MNSEESARLYAEMGVRPIINAAGAYTILGGSALSPTVEAAMQSANNYFVEMRELLESSGRIIAGVLDVEAAYVTSGAAGALALAAAACMTRGDPEKMERLPDPTGMPDEIVIQRGLRVKYDRCVTVPGAHLVEVGDDAGTMPDQLEAALGPKTAAVHFLAPGERPGVLPVKDVIRIAHAHDVPVIVDAAGQTYPLDNLRKYARWGADLVAYAGKYFNAPHSTGLLVGRKDLVEAAALNGFVGFETSGYRTFGRPMKLDRQEIIAVVVALREWLSMNHEERLLTYGARAQRILDNLQNVPNVKAYLMSERETPPPVTREAVCLELDEERLGKTSTQVAAELRLGMPGVWVYAYPGGINVSVAFFRDGEEEIVAERLRLALTA